MLSKRGGKVKTKYAIIAMFVIVTLAFSGIINAVTYSDADGDGVYEIGEVITFIGDDSYVDDEDEEHPFTNWSWDFESDGIIDAYGKEVNHTYNEKGTYVITVYEIGEVNIFTELKIKISLPHVDEENLTYAEVLQQSIYDIGSIIANISDDDNFSYYDDFNLNCAKSLIKWALRKEGKWKWLPFIAVKFAVKDLERVNKRGEQNTTAIMINLGNAVKKRVEDEIIQAEEKYGADDYRVVKAWKRFDKGVIKLEEGRYSKAIEEFYKAYWAI